MEPQTAIYANLDSTAVKIEQQFDVIVVAVVAVGIAQNIFILIR